MERILVAEDDESIRKELCALLGANGYIAVSEPPCELALLDVNMPGESGFELCRKLRTNSSVPVIFLTARSSSEDELIAVGSGADDYIRKPYNSAVLLARIARLLKRQTASVINGRGLTLSLADMRVRYGDKSAELTKNETRILYCLMKKELCTKENIFEDLWENSLYVDENTLYVSINRLRETLRDIGATDFIRTVRGVGYRL